MLILQIMYFQVVSILLGTYVFVGMILFLMLW